MTRFASLSSKSSAVRSRIQAALYHSRKSSRDRRESPRLGPNVLGNPSFENNSSGWSTMGQSTLGNGSVRILSTAGAYSAVSRSVEAVVIGKKYEVAINVLQVVSGRIKIDGCFGDNVDFPQGAGVHRKILTAVKEPKTLFLTRRSGVTDITIGSVTVREVTR